MFPPVERSITVSAPRWIAVQLLQLCLDCAGDGGVADVGVDLAPRGDADAHRFEPFLEVMDVGRNDHAAAGDLAANKFWVEVFAASHECHLRSDNALSCGFKLRHPNPPPDLRSDHCQVLTTALACNSAMALVPAVPQRSSAPPHRIPSATS
jgi:hypothetical protein